jgi:hypothetical protein
MTPCSRGHLRESSSRAPVSTDCHLETLLMLETGQRTDDAMVFIIWKICDVKARRVSRKQRLYKPWASTCATSTRANTSAEPGPDRQTGKRDMTLRSLRLVRSFWRLLTGIFRSGGAVL